MTNNFDKEKNELLELIEHLLKKHENYPEVADVQQLVRDRVEQSKSEILGRDYLLNIIRKRKIESSQHEKILGLNTYKNEMWPEVIAVLVTYAEKYKETERQIMRANYNLHSNNEIFRILDLVYNDNFSTRNVSEINENMHILKINLAMFLINYSYEKMIVDVRSIIQEKLKISGNSKDELSSCFKEITVGNKEVIVDEIISKYKDVQLVGDILGELNCFDEKGELTNILKIKNPSFKRSYKSELKTIRNAASHGEYYPDLEKESSIRLIIDNNAMQKFEYDYTDIIGLANKYVEMLPDQNELMMFLKLFRSNNLENTLYLCLHDETLKNKLIETICILSLFNVVQYNNEKHFRDNADYPLLKSMSVSLNDSHNYLDKLDIGYYFKSTFNPVSSDEVLQTIKYAIGHMNFKFDGEEFLFINPEMNTHKCSCNIGKLLLFISEDEVYNLTMSTSYYERVLKIRKAILDKYLLENNKIIKTPNSDMLTDADINSISEFGLLSQNTNKKK